VRFSCAAGADELLRLRSVDDVFRVCGSVGDIGHTRAALGDLAAWVGRLPLERAVSWVSAAREVRSDLGFEVVASFLGARNYTRYDVEAAVGAAIGERLGLRLVPMREPERAAPDLSFRVHIDHADGVLGIRVGAAPLHRRAYKLDSAPGSLHPPVAYTLGRLAGVRPGQVVLDPFCGAGTALIESGLGAGELAAVGADISRDALRATAANAARAGVRVLAVQADAGRLPLADGAVDRVVGNPPWHNQVEYAGSLASGTEPFWRELARVLTADGRAVLLGVADDAEPALAAAGLVRHVAAKLSLSGTWTTISVVSPL
jgi:23S rRNA G2445 N2-methylase RlmL